jgi:hypothetical protein
MEVSDAVLVHLRVVGARSGPLGTEGRRVGLIQGCLRRGDCWAERIQRQLQAHRCYNWKSVFRSLGVIWGSNIVSNRFPILYHIERNIYYSNNTRVQSKSFSSNRRDAPPARMSSRIVGNQAGMS